MVSIRNFSQKILRPHTFEQCMLTHTDMLGFHGFWVHSIDIMIIIMHKMYSIP